MRPLAGFRVGVTADRRVADQVDHLEQQGAEVVHARTVRTILVDPDELREATLAVVSSPPDMLVATSALGIRSWLTHATSWGLDDAVRASLRETRVLSVGPDTTGELVAAGLDPDVRAEGDIASVAEIVRREAADVRRVTLQLDGDESTEIAKALADAGAMVRTLATYRRTLPEDHAPAHAFVRTVVSGRVHAVTFTSSASFTGLLDLAGEVGQREAVVAALRNGTVTAALGPRTAAAAREVGIEPLVPGLPRIAHLLRDLGASLMSRRRSLVAGGSRVIVQGELVWVDGECVQLSDRERALFELFVGNCGAVLGKEEILHELWGGVRRGEHLVEVTVSRLRERLGPRFAPAIVAVRRRGYRLDAVVR
jgi:uroporphyrinogen-III synthase